MKWLKIEQETKKILGTEIEKFKDSALEDIKDKILFELSFTNELSLSKEDRSKLFLCYYIYFLSDDVRQGKNIANLEHRFYKANSENEAIGAFQKYLTETLKVTPENVSCKWNPAAMEITSDIFINARGEVLNLSSFSVRNFIYVKMFLIKVANGAHYQK